MKSRTLIHDGPLPSSWCDPQQVIGPARGAVASFIGVVRDHAQGRSVRDLLYECYRPMAQRLLDTLIGEAIDRFARDLEVFIAHGMGHMVPGQISICILTASAHRAAALSSTGFLIERIKQDLPVWKRQRYAEGDCVWTPGS